MLAARAGALDVAQVLVGHGADVNAREAWRGQQALMWAADGNFPEVAQFLIANGADVHLRAEPRRTTGMHRSLPSRVRGLAPPAASRRLFLARSGCSQLRASDARGRRGH